MATRRSHSILHLAPCWRTHPIATPVVTLLVLFMVLFPKGGIKVGDVPLTWGYFLLGISLFPLLLVRFFTMPLRFRLSTLLVIASLLPFDALFVYSLILNGYDYFGGVVSDFTSFFVLPTAFLLVYPAFFARVDGLQLERLLRFCILAAALFGIFLFVLYPLTGKLLEVPYLTVNADDYGNLETTKHIVRGPFLKLISTYNNGNLYGVATLVLLPLYSRFEPRLWRRTLVRLALVLTLSRTVWIGLILEQALSMSRLALDFARTFPHFYPGPALKRGAFLFVTVAAIGTGLVLTFGNVSLLFDENLGGRSGDLAASLQHVTLLPAVPINVFTEILYSSALASYGVAGALSMILIFALPVLLFLSNRKVVRSPTRSAALKGLILYMMVSCMDAAISLIPVMVFYWFVYMIFLEGWPGEPDSTLAIAPLPDNVLDRTQPRRFPDRGLQPVAHGPD